MTFPFRLWTADYTYMQLRETFRSFDNFHVDVPIYMRVYAKLINIFTPEYIEGGKTSETAVTTQKARWVWQLQLPLKHYPLCINYTGVFTRIYFMIFLYYC